jgi:hypothetical protein
VAILIAGAILAAARPPLVAGQGSSSSAGSPQASEAKLVDLPFPGPFRFYKENSSGKKDPDLVVAQVPVRLQPGVAASDLKLVVVYGLFGGEDLGADGRAVTAGLIDQTGTQLVRLSGPLSALPKIKRYGTYQFVVEIRTSKNQQVQTLNLPLEYPQTKLVTPSKLQINLRTTFWVEPRAMNGCTFPLRLSDGLPADGVVIEADRLPIGTLSFSPPPRLDAQAGNLVHVKTDGLPMGETTANLTIHSPDIETMTLPMTLNVRETPFSILWIAFVGIVTGAVVRVLADRLIDVEQVKILWIRLRTDIDDQR